MKEWFGIPVSILTPRRHLRLWVKFYWYKYIRRLDIIGFFAGLPIVRTKYLESEEPKDSTRAILEDIIKSLNK